MHIHTRNVNSAFYTLVKLLHTGEHQGEDGAAGRLAGMQAPVTRTTSRNGDVLKVAEPVTVTYSHPRERVLLNAVRDANPFFHLYESLWMLCGRNDIEPLTWYAKKMLEFSDDGKTQNGAYGYRWRHSHNKPPGSRTAGEFEGVDQLEIIINHLKAKPDSRRAVLQMWNVEDDLLKIGSYVRKSRLSEEYFTTLQEADEFAKHNGYPEGCIRRTDEKIQQTEFGRKRYFLYDENATEFSASKDVCCNLSVMFSLREVVRTASREESEDRIDTPGWGSSRVFPDRYLDMTVTNRSNDLVWGMLGANYVHFTILQEYMAAKLGVEVGKYNHFTNDLHAYTWNWKPEQWLEWQESFDQIDDPYEGPDPYEGVPLVEKCDVFDEEVHELVENGWSRTDGSDVVHALGRRNFVEPFLNDVACPMVLAFALHKLGRAQQAVKMCDKIEDAAWRWAASNWLRRRIKEK